MNDTEPGRVPAKLVRVEEAGKILGIRRTKTYELISDGRLWAIHIGRSARISADGLGRFVRAADRPERTHPNEPGQRRTRARRSETREPLTVSDPDPSSEARCTLMPEDQQPSSIRPGGHHDAR